MHRRTCLSFLVVALLLSNASGGGLSDRSCCDQPGERCNHGAVCKLVRTTKTIETVCYGCESEKICIPGPSQRCGTCRQQACRCDCRSLLVWTKWIPGCAQVVRRKTLKKYVVTKEVPSYKWVVVPACQCDAADDIAKPAPSGSQVGDELPATDDEIVSLTRSR